MLVLLAVFGITALLVPFLARRLNSRVFLASALVPAAAFVHTVAQGPAVLAGDAVVETVEWIPQLGLAFATRLDVLSWVLTLIVTGVGALVLVYCWRYFQHVTDGLPRFSGFLLAFAGSMYGLVVVDDVYLLYVMWEATTVFSYLLVGHYSDRRASRVAALKALLVTTLGGLAMLVGLVILAVDAGTSRLSELVAAPPNGPLVPLAVILVLVGAVSKSALVPFHFWLPGAMAAPTPVSAYLHAAAMVKAGVYLVARLAPGFADSPGWRETIVVLGVLTMLVGGWRAIREWDLKLVLAYGTVAQLGFLTLLAGYGTRETMLAALALLVAHALFKSTLFLVVGIIDHKLGTRDLRKLSGVGRSSKALATISALAVASMAGLPPMVGFVAKEGALTAFLDDAATGRPWGAVALVGIVAGSVLTVAYSLRFFWGAFWSKPGVESSRVRATVWFLGPPAVLAVAGLVAGFAAPLLDSAFALVADELPAAAEKDYHLALWHGFETALWLSIVTIALGVGVFAVRHPLSSLQERFAGRITADGVYAATSRGVDRSAARTTAFIQRGSLPVYLGVILLVLVAAGGTALALSRRLPDDIRLWDYPAQAVIAVIMMVAAVAAARSAKRFQAAVLVGVTGTGLAALFAFHGAPDLALTQVLVEIVTLVAFVLVLRVLPAQLGTKHGSVFKRGRAIIAGLVGTLMALVAVVAVGIRTAEPVSVEYPRLAVEEGHGLNIVNVTLVDIRGWDTLGELSVLIVAATGIASLLFVGGRQDDLPTAREARPDAVVDRVQPRRRRDADNDDQRAWLLAGRTLAPRQRSILLEVVVRLVFHALVVLSVYLLFAGHNAPGGGFAGGLVAGLALVARYLAGGRHELVIAAPANAGKLLGLGLVIAGGTAAVPLLFGADALTSVYLSGDLPVLGHLSFTTSSIFDIGVYLVVVGLMLDVLRSLGGEIDRQQEEEVPSEVATHPGQAEVTK
ncbi:Na+/H+ antiporter subunit A [Desertivibrio insolitus]|uniref:Na+/H+ antiporter subunit A n=1 Tax=Herbiconiux sp. SYSU D00978 TaxID=2812562 RepID=UPI001A96D237|nr:Na+/H+ antiporter subunit A [Herbiconiux sp. SYSU D00978]